MGSNPLDQTFYFDFCFFLSLTPVSSQERLAALNQDHFFLKAFLDAFFFFFSFWTELKSPKEKMFCIDEFCNMENTSSFYKL